MSDHPLAPPVFTTPQDLAGSERRQLISWAWLAVFLFLAGFWTTVALLLESALGG
jgi:hypothetical protein